MLTIMFTSTLLLASMTSVTDAFSLRRHYRRPICEPTQSCSYNFKSFTFELCDCPGSRECPLSSAHSVELRGITYQFCTQRQLSICEDEEITAEVLDIQTAINCICPDEMMYIKKVQEFDSRVQYICKEKPMCISEQNCGTVSSQTGKITSSCVCPSGSTCAPITSPSLPATMKQVANATCQLL